MSNPVPALNTINNPIDPPVEQACVFGRNSALIGVYTPACQDHEDAMGETPCVLFLTAGLLHHVGPTRLHVELARVLSRQGVSGLRFDLSGVGDSETGSLGGYFMERSVQEVVQCMDFAQATYGHQRFVLFGLCSGADDALAAALNDKRVVGVAMLNGYAYPAGRFRLHRAISFYLPRLITWRKVSKQLMKIVERLTSTMGNVQETHQQARRVAEPDDEKARRLIARLTSGLNASAGEVVSAIDQAALNALDDDYRYIPPREKTAEYLDELVEQRTDMLFIYTGSEHESYTYQGQLFAMFPALEGSSLVTEHYLAPSDHTVILEEDRVRVIEIVCRWFEHADFARDS